MKNYTVFVTPKNGGVDLHYEFEADSYGHAEEQAEPYISESEFISMISVDFPQSAIKDD